jgi:hypothetical protein
VGAASPAGAGVAAAGGVAIVAAPQLGAVAQQEAVLHAGLQSTTSTPQWQRAFSAQRATLRSQSPKAQIKAEVTCGEQQQACFLTWQPICFAASARTRSSASFKP